MIINKYINKSILMMCGKSSPTSSTDKGKFVTAVTVRPLSRKTLHAGAVFT